MSFGLGRAADPGQGAVPPHRDRGLDAALIAAQRRSRTQRSLQGGLCAAAADLAGEAAMRTGRAPGSLAPGAGMIAKDFFLAKDFNRIGALILRDHGAQRRTHPEIRGDGAERVEPAETALAPETTGSMSQPR
jgi:hypothetical protein